ncbi:hypothetical protein B7463_g10386, partial [Scytalidium lignicola]
MTAKNNNIDDLRLSLQDYLQPIDDKLDLRICGNKTITSHRLYNSLKKEKRTNTIFKFHEEPPDCPYQRNMLPHGAPVHNPEPGGEEASKKIGHGSDTDSNSGATGPVIAQPPKEPQTERLYNTQFMADASVKAVNKDDVSLLATQLQGVMTDRFGKLNFEAEREPFSLFSARGISWINLQSGDTSFQDSLANIVPTREEKNTALIGLKDSSASIEGRNISLMPEKGVARDLLNTYFSSFNHLLPLFDESKFRARFEMDYRPNMSKDDYAWYACLNAMFASSLRFQSTTVPKVTPQEHRDSQLFDNACSVLSMLLFESGNIMAVQALVVMTLYLQSTPNTQAYYVLIGTACRIANSIGLQRSDSEFSNPFVTDSQQRSNVFWSCYLFDKEVSIRSGRPPVFSKGDINVPLPDWNPLDQHGIVRLENGETVNLWRLAIDLACIQDLAYTGLYSASAMAADPIDRRATISKLDRALEEWRIKLPISIRPGHKIRYHGKLMFNVIFVHSTYQYLLSAIHRAASYEQLSTKKASWGNNPSYHILANNESHVDVEIVAQSARETIKLIQHSGLEIGSWLWALLYYQMTAITSLFTHVMIRPNDPQAFQDVILIEQSCSFVAELTKVNHHRGATQILEIMGVLVNVAKKTIERRLQSVHYSDMSSFPLKESELHLGMTEDNVVVAQEYNAKGNLDTNMIENMTSHNGGLGSSEGQIGEPYQETSLDTYVEEDFPIDLWSLPMNWNFNFAEFSGKGFLRTSRGN